MRSIAFSSVCKPTGPARHAPRAAMRLLAGLGLAVSAAFVSMADAWAQGLPQRAAGADGPLTLLVPFPPGGVSDVLARGLGPALSQVAGRPVIVENVTGASGSIAAARFLGGPGDGSQLLVGSPTETVLAPLTIKSLKYQASDFRLLAIVYTAPLALYARPSLDARSLDDLPGFAGRNGGRTLSYGSPGNGSLYHIVTERLRSTMGMQALHVPYRGGGPLLQDLMAGTIDITLLPQDNVVGALVAGGKLKELGVATVRRDAAHPDIPTFDESRLAKGFGYPAVWVGLFVPQAMPEATAAQLHQTVLQALGQPQTRQALQATGGIVPPAMSLAQAQAFYLRETSSLQEMARQADVQPN